MSTTTDLTVPAHRAALFLDIDGTLLDIAPLPDAVAVPATLVETLTRLHHALEGAVAFVSGRMLEEIDRLFVPLRFDAAAEHGAVLRLAGVETSPAVPDERVMAIREAAEAFVAQRPGLLFEAKRHCLAIHYRLCPERQHEIRRFFAATLARFDGGFELLAGKMVWEVRPRGVSKGTAIATMLERPPFRGRHPIFAGDDRTDEDGFAVVARMGGTALRVGHGLRGSGEYVLASPGAMRAWLAELARAAEVNDARVAG